MPRALDAYRASLRGVEFGADRVTTVAQPGSLPIYLGVILLTAAVVPGALLLSGTWWPGWPDVVDLPAHVPLAALMIALALAAAIVRRRFSGALFLGMVGYTMAGLFIVQGAPDLALTQVAIETLTTVLFVLVLRRLPDRFETATGAARRAVRVVVATAVGAIVFLFTLGVGPLDPPTDVSDTMIEQAVPEGDGRNVVNVILVDIRGMDTVGELTVLTAAAIGTVALARAGRRPGREGRTLPPVAVQRLVTVDVSVRIVFPAVMVGSLWLLFAGHNQPGGGFVGGIVAGAAVSLRYVAGGIDEVRRLSRGRPWIVLGTGLLISVTTALVPLLLGGDVMESGSFSLDLPLLGAVKVTSATVFDIGVYLAVLGLALMMFESFGDDVPQAAAAPDMSVLMAFTAAVLFGIGTYLLLQRKLSRLIIGLGLIGHGANIVFVTTTERGDPPIVGSGDTVDFADPLPQALVLTAIVISFGVTAFLLALAYRSFLLTEDDEVADDVEDRNVGHDGRDIELADLDAGERDSP